MNSAFNSSTPDYERAVVGRSLLTGDSQDPSITAETNEIAAPYGTLEKGLRDAHDGQDIASDFVSEAPQSSYSNLRDFERPEEQTGPVSSAAEVGDYSATENLPSLSHADGVCSSTELHIPRLLPLDMFTPRGGNAETSLDENSMKDENALQTFWADSAESNGTPSSQALGEVPNDMWWSSNTAFHEYPTAPTLSATPLLDYPEGLAKSLHDELTADLRDTQDNGQKTDLILDTEDRDLHDVHQTDNGDKKEFTRVDYDSFLQGLSKENKIRSGTSTAGLAVQDTAANERVHRPSDEGTDGIVANYNGEISVTAVSPYEMHDAMFNVVLQNANQGQMQEIPAPRTTSMSFESAENFARNDLYAGACTDILTAAQDIDASLQHEVPQSNGDQWDWDQLPAEDTRTRSQHESSEFSLLTGSLLLSIEDSLTQISRILLPEDAAEVVQSEIEIDERTAGNWPNLLSQVLTDQASVKTLENKEAESLPFLERYAVKRSPYRSDADQLATFLIIDDQLNKDITSENDQILNGSAEVERMLTLLERTMINRQPYLTRASRIESDESAEEIFVSAPVSVNYLESEQLGSMGSDIPRSYWERAPAYIHDVNCPEYLTSADLTDFQKNSQPMPVEGSDPYMPQVSIRPTTLGPTKSDHLMRNRMFSASAGGIAPNQSHVDDVQSAEDLRRSFVNFQDKPEIKKTVSNRTIENAEPFQRAFMFETNSAMEEENSAVEYPAEFWEYYLNVHTGLDTTADSRVLRSAESVESCEQVTLYKKYEQLLELEPPWHFNYDSSEDSSEAFQRDLATLVALTREVQQPEDVSVDFPYNSLPICTPDATTGLDPSADTRTICSVESGIELQLFEMYSRNIACQGMNADLETLESGELDARIAMIYQTISRGGGDSPADEKPLVEKTTLHAHSAESAELLMRETSYADLLKAKETEEIILSSPFENAEVQSRLVMYPEEAQEMHLADSGLVDFDYGGYSPAEHEATLADFGIDTAADTRQVVTVESAEEYQRLDGVPLRDGEVFDESDQSDDEKLENLELKKKSNLKLLDKVKKFLSRTTLVLEERPKLCTVESAEIFQREQMEKSAIQIKDVCSDSCGNFDLLDPRFGQTSVHAMYYSYPALPKASDTSSMITGYGSDASFYSSQNLTAARNIEELKSAAHIHRRQSCLNETQHDTVFDNDYLKYAKSTESTGSEATRDSAELDNRRYTDYMNAHRDDGDESSNLDDLLSDSAECFARAQMFQYQSAAEPEESAVDYPESPLQDLPGNEHESAETLLRQRMYQLQRIEQQDLDYLEDHTFETLESTEEATRVAMYEHPTPEPDFVEEISRPKKENKFVAWFKRKFSKTSKTALLMADNGIVEDIHPLGMNLQISTANTSLNSLAVHDGDISKSERELRHDFLNCTFMQCNRSTDETRPDETMVTLSAHTCPHSTSSASDEDWSASDWSPISMHGGMDTRLSNRGFAYGSPNRLQQARPIQTDSGAASEGETSFFQNQLSNSGDNSHFFGEPISWGKEAGKKGHEVNIDMDAIQPYKKAIEYGGNYGVDTSVILLWAFYLPARTMPRYLYVMEHLFRYISDSLTLLTQKGFTAVYFNYGQDPPPTWLHDCLTRLDSEPGKQLENLFIVHPAYWLKEEFTIQGRQNFSPSLAKKMSFIMDLDGLRRVLPPRVAEYINLPQAVSQYDFSLQHSKIQSSGSEHANNTVAGKF